MIRSLIKLNRSSYITSTHRMSQPIVFNSSSESITSVTAPINSDNQGRAPNLSKSKGKLDRRPPEEGWIAPKQIPAGERSFMYSSSVPAIGTPTARRRFGGVNRTPIVVGRAAPIVSAAPRLQQPPLAPKTPVVELERLPAKKSTPQRGIGLKINVVEGSQIVPVSEKKKKSRQKKRKSGVAGPVPKPDQPQNQLSAESDGSSSIDEDRTELFSQLTLQDEYEAGLGVQIRRLYEVRETTPVLVENYSSDTLSINRLNVPHPRLWKLD